MHSKNDKGVDRLSHFPCVIVLWPFVVAERLAAYKWKKQKEEEIT